MLAFYGADEDERSVAHTMWEDTRQASTRVQHSAAHPKSVRAFLRAEADAVTERTVDPIGIPGLLQTEGYASAVHAAAHRFHANDPKVGQRAVSARLNRQHVLHGARPLQFHALIDEGVIHRATGGPTVMAEQLRHLLTACERPNVTVQVIPFGIGAYGTASGGVILLGYPDVEDRDEVYLEYPGGGTWVDDDEDVRRFVAMFEDVAAVVLTAEESTELIQAQAERLEDS